MRKIEQEKLLNLLNEKARMKKEYAELDRHILSLAHEIGCQSVCIEVEPSLKKAYPDLAISETQKYFRMSLVDNIEIFSLSESDDDTPMVMFRPAKFSRFEIEGKALKNKPKDME